MNFKEKLKYIGQMYNKLLFSRDLYMREEESFKYKFYFNGNVYVLNFNNKGLKKEIEKVRNLFLKKIMNKQRQHLKKAQMFFNNKDVYINIIINGEEKKVKVYSISLYIYLINYIFNNKLYTKEIDLDKYHLVRELEKNEIIRERINKVYEYYLKLERFIDNLHNKVKILYEKQKIYEKL